MKLQKKTVAALISVAATLCILLILSLIGILKETEALKDCVTFEMLPLLIFFSMPALCGLIGAIIYKHTRVMLAPTVACAATIFVFGFLTEIIVDLINTGFFPVGGIGAFIVSGGICGVFALVGAFACSVFLNSGLNRPKKDGVQNGESATQTEAEKPSKSQNVKFILILTFCDLFFSFWGGYIFLAPQGDEGAFNAAFFVCVTLVPMLAYFAQKYIKSLPAFLIGTAISSLVIVLADLGFGILDLILENDTAVFFDPIICAMLFMHLAYTGYYLLIYSVKKWHKKPLSSGLVYTLFTLAILASGFVLMIVTYEKNYFAVHGYYVPGFLLPMACLPLISGAFMIIGVMIKRSERVKIRLTALVLIAFFLPPVQFVFNYVAKEFSDLPVISHFFAICEGDFNFDGINDKLYKEKYTKRTVENETYIREQDMSPFSKIVTVTTGGGLNLETSGVNLDDLRGNMIYVIPYDCKIDSVEIYITFDDPALADDYKFLLKDEGYEIVLEGELVEDSVLKLTVPNDYIEKFKPALNEPASVSRDMRWQKK